MRDIVSTYWTMNGIEKEGDSPRFVNFRLMRRPLLRKRIRAADAKEVGVGNPAEETCCYPNRVSL